jgi:hypothetical protein
LKVGIVATLLRLCRGEEGPRARARQLLGKLIEQLSPAHRTNASGNNQSQR